MAATLKLAKLRDAAHEGVCSEQHTLEKRGAHLGNQFHRLRRGTLPEQAPHG